MDVSTFERIRYRFDVAESCSERHVKVKVLLCARLRYTNTLLLRAPWTVDVSKCGRRCVFSFPNHRPRVADSVNGRMRSARARGGVVLHTRRVVIPLAGRDAIDASASTVTFTGGQRACFQLRAPRERTMEMNEARALSRCSLTSSSPFTRPRLVSLWLLLVARHEGRPFR